jgi:hypothetical protein
MLVSIKSPTYFSSQLDSQFNNEFSIIFFLFLIYKTVK